MKHRWKSPDLMQLEAVGSTYHVLQPSIKANELLISHVRRLRCSTHILQHAENTDVRKIKVKVSP